MEYRVKPKVPFLPEADIEAVADSLLSRYEAREGIIDAPPVPIEFIAEDFLGFELRWDNLPYDTLAYVDPNASIICFNLERSDYFDNIGNEFTLAHEIGHPELGHFEEAQAQLALGLQNEPKQFLHRDKQQSKYSSHEFQAEYFASCLLMPRKLILPAVAKHDLTRWKSITELGKQFSVSRTAMVKRLEALGLVFKVDTKLYKSKEPANGQRRLI